MKIQQQNSYNPNMKALHFTKVYPTVAEAVKYKDQKLTQNGIKYVEDTSAKLTPIMREAFEENRFIKKLAEKFDVFVQYLGERFDYGAFCTSANIHVVRKGEEGCLLSDFYIFNAQDEYTPEGAR
jgi:hypothetical protein